MVYCCNESHGIPLQVLREDIAWLPRVLHDIPELARLLSPKGPEGMSYTLEVDRYVRGIVRARIHLSR